MNTNLSDFITIFFEKMTKILAYFLLLLILYKYFFVRNNLIINITYKELYIIVFASIISGIFLSIAKKNKISS